MRQSFAFCQVFIPQNGANVTRLLVMRPDRVQALDSPFQMGIVLARLGLAGWQLAAVVPGVYSTQFYMQKPIARPETNRLAVRTWPHRRGVLRPETVCDSLEIDRGAAPDLRLSP